MKSEPSEQLTQHTESCGTIRKRRTVAKCTCGCRQFPCNTLNDLPNGHTGRQCMRINNHVGFYTRSCVGHICFWNHHSNSSLLTGTGGKLVTQIGDTFFTDSHFGNALPFFAICHKYFVDHSQLSFLRFLGRIFANVLVWDQITLSN